MELLRRDRWLRRSVVVLAVAAFVWFLVAHTTFLTGWTLDGSPANLGQIRAWCSSYDGQLYVLSGVNQSASACASSSKWWAFDGFLEIVMVVTVIIVGFRVYRYNPEAPPADAGILAPLTCR